MKIKRFEFNMFPVNCYVLWDDTKEAVVIDPGCFYEEEKQALKKFILTNELNVKHLLNTHLHLDHIFGILHAEEFDYRQKQTKQTSIWIDEAPKQSRMFWLSVAGRTCTIGQIPARRRYHHFRTYQTGSNTRARTFTRQLGVLLQRRQLHVLR